MLILNWLKLQTKIKQISVSTIFNEKLFSYDCQLKTIKDKYRMKPSYLLFKSSQAPFNLIVYELGIMNQRG